MSIFGHDFPQNRSGTKPSLRYMPRIEWGNNLLAHICIPNFGGPSILLTATTHFKEYHKGICVISHNIRITLAPSNKQCSIDVRRHYGVGSWSLYTKQATPGSPPLLCRGHPTQSATSTMEPQGFQWALTQWRRSPVKVTRSPWDYLLKTQNGWQPTCVDMQNNVENVFVECTIYFLTIMELTEAGLSIWQVQ